jgi:predicted dehydrogenase
MQEPVRIGLVGAGPWAQLFTAPMLSQAAGAQFVGVWARRPEAAGVVAAAHNTESYDDVAALIEASDALAFNVPPSVQARLAMMAVEAGKAILLEKPLSQTVHEAEALADVVAGAGVVSQMVLTNRYTAEMRSFLSAAAVFDAYGGRASFFGNGCVPGTTFGTPWRVAEGGLLDLGPHVLDALEAALGPVRAISARGDVHRLVLLTCEH